MHDSGGGVNFQFTPLDPEYTLSVQAGVKDFAYIYGTKYWEP